MGVVDHFRYSADVFCPWVMVPVAFLQLAVGASQVVMCVRTFFQGFLYVQMDKSFTVQLDNAVHQMVLWWFSFRRFEIDISVGKNIRFL